MSINFDNMSLFQLLEMQAVLQEMVFNDILTEKMKEGKMVFSGTISPQLH